jgi:hypothetical protein
MSGGLKIRIKGMIAVQPPSLRAVFFPWSLYKILSTLPLA